MRKVLIGFVSLGVVLGFYLLYGHYNVRPDLNTDPAVEAAKSAVDANAVGLGEQMGKIGDVGVGPAEKAYYVTRDPKTREIVREFGFEKLLHQVRDVWEIEKPYMNVYRRNFKCYVTADKGQVHVETAVGRTTPKDATFSSNVVIHLVPVGKSTFKESFVYLDNIIFLGEKSMISTPGPIRVESEDARMKGRGLQIIYNEHAARLEYFRIADLESLSYRVANAQTSARPSNRKPADPNVPVKAQEPNETAVATAPGENSVNSTLQDANLTTSDQPEGEYYDCVLNDNVLIDAPEQLIFADEKLHIHDVFWSTSFIDQADRADPDARSKAETAGPADAQEAQGDANAVEPNKAPEKSAFVVITCDGGLTITPRDSSRMHDESVDTGSSAAYQTGVGDKVSAKECRKQLDDGTERTKFFARTIDYDAMTGDVTAGGLSELTYYEANTTEDERPRSGNSGTVARSSEPEQQALSEKPQVASQKIGPLKVTAREGAKYTKASNEVVFTDCLCTMLQPGLTERRDVTFSAPKITVDLSRGRSGQPDLLAAGPIELAFYMEPGAPSTDPNVSAEDANRPTMKGELIPVTVKARKRAHYSGDLNQMAFEGDCRCTMLREDPNVIEKYVLLSDRMTVDLAADANDRTPGPASGIEHLTATGKVVRLATTRTRRPAPPVKMDEGRGTIDDGRVADHADDVLPSNQDQDDTETLGGIELKCSQFDYDAVQQLFWATGPGVIKLNNEHSTPDTRDSDASPLAKTLDVQNSKIEDSEPRFSLRDPCWAIVSGFETLTYSLRENRIVADAAPGEKLWLFYLPAGANEDSAASSIQGPGNTGRDVTARASHVEVLLRETDDGQTELATLEATGGILYEDDRGHQFIGNELFYDHTTAIVTVEGDGLQPCYYNGSLVDQIRYDINTDKVECNVIGPSSIVF